MARGCVTRGLGSAVAVARRIQLKAIMTVVTLCDGNVTNRHDITANL